MAPANGLIYCSRFAQRDGAIGTVFIAQPSPAPPPYGPGVLGPPEPNETMADVWAALWPKFAWRTDAAVTKNNYDYIVGGFGIWHAATQSFTVDDPGKGAPLDPWGVPIPVDSSWSGYITIGYASWQTFLFAIGAAQTGNWAEYTYIGYLFTITGVNGRTLTVAPATPDPSGLVDGGRYSFEIGFPIGWNPPTVVWNGFYPPSWSGRVDVSGFEVDWWQGDLFNPSMVGLLIELGLQPSVGYLVSAVSPDGKTITIATEYYNPATGGNSTADELYWVAYP